MSERSRFFETNNSAEHAAVRLARDSDPYHSHRDTAQRAMQQGPTRGGVRRDSAVLLLQRTAREAFLQRITRLRGLHR
jgi:hypothetical protein